MSISRERRTELREMAMRWREVGINADNIMTDELIALLDMTDELEALRQDIDERGRR